MLSLNLRRLLILFGIALIARPAHALDSAAFERSASGVTFRNSDRTMLVAVCTDRVIHVVVSPTKDIPQSNVPSVTRPCSGIPFKMSSTAASVSIRTPSLMVEIDRASLAVRFDNSAGQTVLAEQKNNGRSQRDYNHPSLSYNRNTDS